ncbi:dTDP-4-amino-4,6-dideoxygalactose transaminase [Modicisalibacter muralis]|uniref:dTDP-4-amino-4,6-dideoxygalactose transaminase n=1 Tax=Modicisalibacter muralis TaxID=119000 RepID=A0A1G9M1Z4_9GAMM|nr:DegT/DnrJ/EryC1/StrS family aminotransferase [Halomonas muralis]SDL67735.1 dTDP-4-amino-4,6-dideoxygalactose transaminase [Halomonas muralis]
MADEPIFVTQPYLPPLEEFTPYLEQIWANKQLTNGGPMHQQLEQALSDYLGVPELALFNNGTNALLTALQAMNVTGEVITTPYSFAATAHSILWNGLTPVFVDIDPVTLNIDPKKIEAAITPNTSAIMPVHCYGNPCDVTAIKQIADKHNLRVVYDAAHAFGVEDAGGSILCHGDLSVLSFHATKVFNTFEGGAIICPDTKTKQHINNLKNFGIVDEVTVTETGLNGKMSEINAAFGLLQLQHMEAVLEGRRWVAQSYREQLSDVPGIIIVPAKEQIVSNNSYFPILIGPEYPLSRDELYQKMKDHNIFARRYFYPLISDFPMYSSLKSAKQSNLPVATHVAKQVLCLPAYPDLTDADLNKVAKVING